MKFEVDDKVQRLLDGDITPGANYCVVLRQGNCNELLDVGSKDFTRETLEGMFILATKDMTQEYRVELRLVQEHLYGIQIKSKIALDDLEALVDQPPELASHTVALRVFGKNQPSAGYVFRLHEVVLYPILVALTTTNTYKRIEVEYF